MTMMMLTLLACGAGTTSGDSATTEDTDTGPVYDNSYCEEDGHTDAQQACCDYIAAYNTCADTYGSSDWKDGETTGCAATGEETETTWSCLEAVFTDADCSTTEGWQGAIQSATGC